MAYDENTVLGLVKTRINRPQPIAALDDYLRERIRSAAEEMERDGIQLGESRAEDTMLLVDMTVYQYQNRDSAGGVPDWLRNRYRKRWMRGDP